MAVAGTVLQRTLLAVPGSRPELFEKAARGGADRVLLDLEDSVAPDDKGAARVNVIDGLHGVDWAGQGTPASVRVNALDTPWMYRDLIEVVERAGDRLDAIVLPKAGGPADVHLVDVLLGQIERAVGIDRPIAIEPIVETALGLTNVEAIVRAGPRVRAIHFGPGDMAADLRARTVGIGGLSPDYPGDPWHAALSRIVVACRAHGREPIDGPFGDLADAEGFLASARRAAALGCAGKLVVHPSQVGPANDVFSPSAEELAEARRILEALAGAAAAGRGAATLDGRLIDAVSARLAENVVAMADAIGRG